MKKGSPIVFEAGLTVADVEDVARGHLLAERFGRPSQDYILGGEQMKVIDIFATLASLLQLPPPRRKLPKWAMILGAAGLQAAAALTSSTPLMTVRQARPFRRQLRLLLLREGASRVGLLSSARRGDAEAHGRVVSHHRSDPGGSSRTLLRARMADA